MKQLDVALDNLAETLKSARQIIFALAGFSVAAIYLVVLSGGALKQEISQLESEAQSLKEMIARGNLTLGSLRVFYEDPVEADSLNFASFIYALEVTEFELGLALARVNSAALPQHDRAFLEFQSDLVRSNVYELRSVVGGLITQKKTRIPFDSLPIADIRDLDYHKGKDAWGLYNDFSALRYALQNPESYGFQKSTANIVGLENRFKHYRREGEKNQAKRTKPASAGHTPAVTAYLAEMSTAGYRSIADVHSKLAAVEKRAEEKRKQSESSLKLPFLDQPIDVSTLGWVVPVTAAVALLFCLFYVNRARELYRFARSLDANATRAKLMYPWVFLWQAEQTRLSQTVAVVLQFALIGSPVVASLLFLALVQRSSTGALASSILADLCLSAIVVVVAFVLASFRDELRQPHTPGSDKGQPPGARSLSG